jgi:8-oxo-dGTP diphosphatase
MTNQLSTSTEHPRVAVDLIIFSIVKEELSVALIQMKKKPFEGKWAFPGGLIGIEEELEEAATRELLEKTNISDIYLEQLYTAGGVKRDPLGRVISVVYFALLNSNEITLKTTTKYKAIRWFPINELPQLAYDHSKMAQIAYERLKGKLTYTNIVYGLLPDCFTLSELQRTYEIILNRKLDKRNFRKKILSSKTLIATDKHRSTNAHRPALLYSFKEKKPQIIEML